MKAHASTLMVKLCDETEASNVLSKSATELSNLIDKDKTSLIRVSSNPNCLQLPGKLEKERVRRNSSVSFCFTDDQKSGDGGDEKEETLSRNNSLLTRMLRSPRLSVISRLSDLANQSTRPSSLYSSLSNQSKGSQRQQDLKLRILIPCVVLTILVLFLVLVLIIS